MLVVFFLYNMLLHMAYDEVCPRGLESHLCRKVYCMHQRVVITLHANQVIFCDKRDYEAWIFQTIWIFL